MGTGAGTGTDADPDADPDAAADAVAVAAPVPDVHPPNVPIALYARYRLTLALLLALSGCNRATESSARDANAPAAAAPWFEPVGPDSGFDFVHTSGASGSYWFPEIATGGAGLVDYDGDGLLDLYLVQGGTLEPGAPRTDGNRLYRNLGSWRFEEVTASTGIGDNGYGMGCACGDYDGDGDDDIYVTNLGANVLYRNEGDGTFTDVTADAGVGHAGWSTGAAFADYDDDGAMDLFVVSYVVWDHGREISCASPGGRRDYCSPKNYQAPARDVLYRGRGDGTFEDVTEASGLGAAFGNGFGIACADYDGDGRLDFYVANDATANQLWLQQQPGRFTDSAMARGCALDHYGWAEAGMGVAAIDIENDGDLDLFMTHLQEETNTLYVNQRGRFEDATVGAGLAAPSKGFTGFGMGFADFDHDGVQDLYVANGRVKLASPRWADDPYAEPDQLFRGLGGGRFEELALRGGTAQPLFGAGRAAAFGDLDGDGDVDILIVNRDGPAHLLRNVAADGAWITLRVRNAHGNDAYGALVDVQDDRGASHWRNVQRAYSYCASNDPRVHVGLGNATRAERVNVRWHGGAVETFGPFEAGEEYEVRMKVESRK